MGCDYYCDCVIGVKLSVKEIEKVISEAVYEDQKRYDTKTGLVSHVERVLVKQREVKYRFGNLEFDDVWDMESYKDAESTQFKFLYDNHKNEIYFGYLFKKTGRFDFTYADVSVSVEDLVTILEKTGNKVKEIGLDLEAIKLYIVPSISC